MSDQFLGTIVLAAFVLLGNLFRKGGWFERWRQRRGASPKPPPLPSSSGSRDPASPDAQMRRLLEALGRPATDALPPPLPPAPKNRPPVLTARPPGRTGDILSLPSLPKSTSKKQRRREERERQQREAASRANERSRPPVPVAAVPGGSVVERAAREITAPLSLPPLSLARERAAAPELRASSLRQRFSRKDSAREAVLLSEILGPPLALRLPAADAQFS